MLVDFVLPVRYPTQKAYGVTVGCTAVEFRRIGSEVRIFSSASDANTDQFGSPVISLEATNSLKLFSRLPRFSYLLSQLQFLHKYLSLTRNTVLPDLVWTRSSIVAAGVRLINRKSLVVLELHDSRIKSDHFFYKFMHRSDKIIFGFLTKTNEKNFQSAGLAKLGCILPMAAPYYFFRTTHVQELERNVAFFGKWFTNGEDNNLHLLVESFLKSISRNSPFKLILIGLESSKMVEICELFTNLGIPEGLWEIRAHLSHENLAKEISKVNCGVIPYADTPFNNERFPIKLVEFAAARVPILISDIPSHRLLIPQDGALFFKPDSESLLEAINLRYSDLLNTEQRTEWAYKWSGSYTYETRVKTVLQFL